MFIFHDSILKFTQSDSYLVVINLFISLFFTPYRSSEYLPYTTAISSMVHLTVHSIRECLENKAFNLLAFTSRWPDVYVMCHLRDELDRRQRNSAVIWCSRWLMNAAA